MIQNITREVLYQGHIPVKENGYKCSVCGMEWWPPYPGCNKAGWVDWNHKHDPVKPPVAEQEIAVSLEEYEF